MRVFLFLNNWGGWQVAKWLKQRGEDVVGVAVHRQSDQRFAEEILTTLSLPADRVWRAPQLREPDSLARIRELQPEIGVAGWFAYILKPDLLQIFSHGCLNLHAAYLPWNKGWRTNVWPILDGSPAGVTVHYIDEGVDTGDIIMQRQIPVEPMDTGGTLLQKLICAEIDLFKTVWPLVLKGKGPRTPQDHTNSTSHRRDDLEALDCIELDGKYVVGHLLNLLRARTCLPYPGAYFLDDSQKNYITVEFSDEQDSAAESHRPGPEPVCVDLEQSIKAVEILKILEGPPGGGGWPAFFMHDSRRIYVRTNLLREDDFDPAASPAFMTEA